MADPDDLDRWNLLATDLGLPTKGEDPVVPAVEKPADAPDAGATPTAEPPGRGRRRRAPARAARGEAGDAQPEVPAPSEAAELDIAPAAENQEGTDPGSEKTGRRRRRRRRKPAAAGEAAVRVVGKEPGGEAPATHLAGQPRDLSGDAPLEEGGGEPRQRGRPSSRRDEAETLAPVAETEAPARAAPLPVESEEEVDDLSNLILPTWVDLIASLYRPER
jgi:hypothetical protein